MCCVFALLTATVAGSLSETASAAARSKSVRYRGYRIDVPATWPVFDLSSNPTACVRFNRHAVYLGRPGSAQRCPAHAVGRTEAILIEPLTARAASPAAGASLGASLTGGSVTRLVVPARGVTVTATWAGHRQTVARALHRRSLPVPAAHQVARSASAGRRGRAQAAAVYTGLGFDACTAPSTSTMAAWGASPYHAVGIYLGGADSACSQPNLTPAWVSQQTAVGWHLIPTYVGLQAPSNSCGCAGIVPGKASAEGTAAALDAVQRAQALGIGAGSPIYDDMEAFPLSASNNKAVLAFLSAWTTQLHASGYVSGVYSSSNSGIHLLASQTGTAFLEPDDIWVANWNGQQSTSDPNLPAGDWASHQRLHQYLGGHNATYGGVTLDIDSDYLDGATAGTPVTLTPTPTPTATIAPMANGSIRVSAVWPGQVGIQSWRLYGGDNPAALTPSGPPSKGGASTQFTVHNAFAFFAVQALGSAGQVLGTTPLRATPAHLAIYGRGVFVPRRGLAGLPVGCFTSGPCSLTTTISVGSAVLATTGPESVPADSGGIVYFKLTRAGRARLAAAGHRLAVRVRERDVSGKSVTTKLNLVPFQTQGRPPRRSLADSPTLRLVGATEFVFRHSVGGILAGCFSATPCRVLTRITAGGSTIASTTPESLGAHQAGYLIFRLTGHGRALLAKAKGNQLGVTVTVSSVATVSGAGGGAGAGVGAASQASGHVVLVSYN